MSAWTRSDTIEGNGYFWENPVLGISAFDAGQSGTFDTRDDAVADLIDIIENGLGDR